MTYVSASAGSTYTISGSGIFTAVGTAVAVITLVYLIRNGNRKARREVAQDIDKAYARGRRDQYRELRPFLDMYKEASKGQILPSVPPPPDPPEDDDEDEDDG